MATSCEIKSTNNKINDFLKNGPESRSWIDLLKEDLNASRDEFLASVQTNYADNMLGLKQIQKKLTDNGIEIDLMDMMPNQKQTYSKFSYWELKDSNSEIDIFKTNTTLNRKFKHDFSLEAFKYGVVNTQYGALIPLVDSNSQLIDNISQFKNDLIQRLITELNPFYPELTDYDGEILFDSSFGADGEAYNNIMQRAYELLQEYIPNLDLSTLDVSDENSATLRDITYLTFALNNFDYLFDESMKDLVEKSNKRQFGDLNRTEYSLMRTLQSEQQDIRVISEQSGNAVNYVHPDTKKIISTIPVVRYRLRDPKQRFVFDASGATLQLPHVLQLSHWLQINLSDIARIFKLQELDLQERPEHTIRTVFQALHDAIDNYKESTVSREIKDFVKKKNTRSAISTALSLYEYMFNEAQRINRNTVPISNINSQYNGMPKYNINNALIQQLLSSTAPAYIEHNMDGTIYDTSNSESLDPIATNYIQRYELSRMKYAFLNPLTKCAYKESLKQDSKVENTLIKWKSKSLKQALQDNDYVSVICQLFNISNVDANNVKELMLEANGESEILKQMLDQIGNVIKSARSRTMDSPLTYWNQIKNDVKNACNPCYEQLGAILGPLINATPSPTFADRSGNQLGVYRVPSLVFMFDHLIKRYKAPSEIETEKIKESTKQNPYRPLRRRSNVFVDNPELLAQGKNANYLSTVAIPLTMGNVDTNVEARKQPEFIQDLHGFVGEFLSLMCATKDHVKTPMLAFQLGTYSDKSTLPQLCINALSELRGSEKVIQGGARRTSITLEKLLSDKQFLLNYMQAYQSTKTIDLVNHILTDWKDLFSRIDSSLTNIGSDSSRKFVSDLLTEGTEANQALLDFQNFISLNDELIDNSPLVRKSNGEIDVENSSHAALFDFFLQNPTRIECVNSLFSKVNDFRARLENGIEALNKLLYLMPKSFMQEVVPIAAQGNENRRGIKIVDKLYVDTYKKHYAFNNMVLDDLRKDCTIQKAELQNLNTDSEYSDYYYRMFVDAWNKPYIINGEKKTFGEYLVNYFHNNIGKLQSMIDPKDNRKISNRVKIFDSLFNANGTFNATYDGEKADSPMLADLYFKYLTLTSFLRHQALDLSVKEAYFDKGANSDPVKERSKRQQTTTKRNNTFTAPVTPFQMDMVEGVSSKINICIIEDIQGGVFNTIGVDREVDEFDGLGFTSPIETRMEDASLGYKHKVSTKKTFITPISDYSAEELKWASNDLDNKKIRESQGCKINLLSIFKRMHSGKFNYDITKFWENDEAYPIYLNSLIDKNYYTREGFNYYRYSTIRSVEGESGTYILTRYQVDPKTGQDIPNTMERITKNNVDSIYAIYDMLNGINCMELTANGLEYSDNIMDILYQLTIKVGERKDPTSSIIDQHSIIQPLRNTFVNVLATHSSNKRGASNIISGKAWYDDSIPLSTTVVEYSTGGEQLNAEHESDGSEITKGTQLMQDIAQKGYTSELVENVYKAISKVMEQSSASFDAIVDILNKGDISGMQENISEKIVKQLTLDGTNEELQNLIARFKEESEALGEPFILPLTLLTKDVIKSYAPDLNKNVIKQKDSGLMGTLNGSSGFVQTYRLNGVTYTLNDFLTSKNIEKFKAYSDTIQSFCEQSSVPFNEVIRQLSVLDKLGDLESAEQYYKGLERSAFQFGDDPKQLKWLSNLLQDFNHKGARFGAAQAYFAVNPDAKEFLGFKKLETTELQPGITVIDQHAQDFTPITVESSKQILELQESTDSVLQDMLIPNDLQAAITTIQTESGHIENEYTASEAILGARINRLSDNIDFLREEVQSGTKSLDDAVQEIKENADFQSLLELCQYINSFDSSLVDLTIRMSNPVSYLVRADSTNFKNSDFLKLAQIQEDVQNFKNHVKSFGYSLKDNSENMSSHFGGFNPRKHFEFQLQNVILHEDFASAFYPTRYTAASYDVNQTFRAIKFYYDHKASTEKKAALREVCGDIFDSPNISFAEKRRACDELLVMRPEFMFKLLPYNKYARYKEYLENHDAFEKITDIKTDTAQIIMPSIYRGQMRLGNMDLVDIDINFYKKAPTFYNIDSSLVDPETKIVDTDFVVRTFRGKYNIVVTSDLTDSSLDKYGDTLTDDYILIEDGNRIDKRSKQKLYKLPENTPYIIKRNGTTETIILKQDSNIKNTLNEIEALLKSDDSLVSVQPFLSRLLDQRTNEYDIIPFLQNVQLLNTIPSFDRMYTRLYQLYNLGAAQYNRMNKSGIKTRLGEDYENVKDDYEEKYKNSLYVSFLRSLDVIATRIPTQNMSSIMTMKITAFTKSNVNDVFVTKWQQWLQGSDYDIDKAFILGYNFDDYGRFITWSSLQKTYDDQVFNTSLELPLPNGKEAVVEYSDQTFDDKMNQLLYDYQMLYACKTHSQGDTQRSIFNQLSQKYDVKLQDKFTTDYDCLQLTLLSDIIKRVQEVGGFYVPFNYENTEVFNEVQQLVNRHNLTEKSPAGYKNYATYQMHKIMNSPKNATTAYKSIDIATGAYNNPIEVLTEAEQKIYNLDDGHTVSSITVSGAVGKDDVGIGANGVKGQFTLLNYFNRIFDADEPISMKELERSHYFNISRIKLTYDIEETRDESGNVQQRKWERAVGPVADTLMNDSTKDLYAAENEGNDIYVYDRDASQDTGALLSLAADNAKTLNLDKMNAQTDYFAMHIFLAMIGCPPEIIVRYFRSGAFKSVIDNAANNLAEGQIPMINFNTFLDAKQFELAYIYACAKELTNISQVLGINQGLKVEEEELVGQRQKLEKAYKDALTLRQIMGPKSVLVTDSALFNPDAIDAIKSNFINFGSISVQMIQDRMTRANTAMQNAGINVFTPFDFDRFWKDGTYREAVKCIMDVLKFNYNIFDVIDKVPHFAQMFKKYNELIQIYTKSDALMDFEVNKAPELYDRDIVDRSLSVQDEGDWFDEVAAIEEEYGRSYKPQIYLPSVYNKNMTTKARNAFLQTTFEKFLQTTGPEYSFRYTAQDNHHTSHYCNFATENALHEFVDFINTSIIPELFEKYPDNKFLEGLEINDKEASYNGNLFFSFNENLNILANADIAGSTRLYQIKQDFNKIKNIKIRDLVTNGILELNNENTTVGDYLYLYNKIMKIASPSVYDFDSLFTDFGSNDMKTKYYKFVRDVDTGKIKVELTPELFMAHIMRNLVRSKNGEKVIAYTDSKAHPSIVLQTNENGAKWSKYLLGMPKIQAVSQDVELADLFTSALLNDRLKITEVNENCE